MPRLVVIILCLLPALGFSQKVKVSGVVMDDASGETLIGANVLFEEGLGTVTDINGQFSLSVDPGEYRLQISYVGYQTIQQEISASGKSQFFEFYMESLVIDEVIVTADVARSRKTPVAFTMKDPDVQPDAPTTVYKPYPNDYTVPFSYPHPVTGEEII